MLPRPPRQLICRLADALYGKACSSRQSEDEDDEDPEDTESRAEGDEEDESVKEGREGKRGNTMQALKAEANRLYQAAFDEDPNDSFAVNGLSLFAPPEGKRKLLELAVHLDGENPYALANLGSDLLGEDDRRALSYLQRALQVNPKLFYARLFKCQALARLGDLDGAIEAVSEQLSLRPEDTVAQRFFAGLRDLRARHDVRRDMMHQD